MRFIEFLIEGKEARDAASKGLGGWFNVRTKRRIDTYNHEMHAETIQNHPREFGLSYDDADEDGNVWAMDGQYGPFYKRGWIRWLIEYDKPENITFLKLTSSQRVLQSARAKEMIEDLVRELKPDILWVSNAYDTSRDAKQPWRPDFERMIPSPAKFGEKRGDELKKVIAGGDLVL